MLTIVHTHGNVKQWSHGSISIHSVLHISVIICVYTWRQFFYRSMLFNHICIINLTNEMLTEFINIHLDMCNLYVVPKFYRNIILFGILLLF